MKTYRIAAIGGVAYGGGMCLSLGADLRVASDTAVFNATGIVNGLASTEMGISFLLPRLIGAAHSNDLLLTGRRVGAEEALRMGLVSRVVPADEIEDLAVRIDAATVEPVLLARLATRPRGMRPSELLAVAFPAACGRPPESFLTTCPARDQ